MVAHLMLVGDKIRKNMGKHRKIFDDEQRSPNRRGVPRAWVSEVRKLSLKLPNQKAAVASEGGGLFLDAGVI